MRKIVIWLKAGIVRLIGVNEAPSVELDIMKELAFVDEGLSDEDLESTELSNIVFNL